MTDKFEIVILETQAKIARELQERYEYCKNIYESTLNMVKNAKAENHKLNDYQKTELENLKYSWQWIKKAVGSNPTKTFVKTSKDWDEINAFKECFSNVIKSAEELWYSIRGETLMCHKKPTVRKSKRVIKRRK